VFQDLFNHIRIFNESNDPHSTGTLWSYEGVDLAAREATILVPYIELCFDKRIIRALCNHYGLEIADKPAMLGLASRIANVEEVTVEKLLQIEIAEDFLRQLGFHILRVRHHGDTARIEILPENFEALPQKRDAITN
jgi:uncharacterized protein